MNHKSQKQTFTRMIFKNGLLIFLHKLGKAIKVYFNFFIWNYWQLCLLFNLYIMNQKFLLRGSARNWFKIPLYGDLLESLIVESVWSWSIFFWLKFVTPLSFICLCLKFFKLLSLSFWIRSWLKDPRNFGFQKSLIIDFLCSSLSNKFGEKHQSPSDIKLLSTAKIK